MSGKIEISRELAENLASHSQAVRNQAAFVLRGLLGSSVEYGPTPGCKQCEEAESCGLTDCPECDAKLCEDVNGTGVKP